jgi:hypothetical protein
VLLKGKGTEENLQQHVDSFLKKFLRKNLTD